MKNYKIAKENSKFIRFNKVTTKVNIYFFNINKFILDSQSKPKIDQYKKRQNFQK